MLVTYSRCHGSNNKDNALQNQAGDGSATLPDDNNQGSHDSGESSPPKDDVLPPDQPTDAPAPPEPSDSDEEVQEVVNTDKEAPHPKTLRLVEPQAYESDLPDQGSIPSAKRLQPDISAPRSSNSTAGSSTDVKSKANTAPQAGKEKKSSPPISTSESKPTKSGAQKQVRKPLSTEDLKLKDSWPPGRTVPTGMLTEADSSWRSGRTLKHLTGHHLITGSPSMVKREPYYRKDWIRQSL